MSEKYYSVSHLTAKEFQSYRNDPRWDDVHELGLKWGRFNDANVLSMNVMLDHGVLR